MNAPQDITSAVSDMIDQLLASNGRCRTEDVVTAVISSWSPPGGADEDKWMHCGYMAVSKVAADRARAFAPKDDGGEEPQLYLDGYEKLHRAYLVKGRIVRTDKLTVSEAMDVLAELDRVAIGLRIHRNELQRYIDEVLIPAGNGD